jgi:hypothetical protein
MRRLKKQISFAVAILLCTTGANLAAQGGELHPRPLKLQIPAGTQASTWKPSLGALDFDSNRAKNGNVFSATGPQTANSSSDWSPVAALRAGQKVRIDTGGAKIVGRLVTTTPSAVTLRSRTGDISIASERILTVSAIPPGKEWHTALGFVTYAAVQAICVAAYAGGFGEDGDPVRGASCNLLAIPAGLAIGLQGRYRQIYRAPRP